MTEPIRQPSRVVGLPLIVQKDGAWKVRFRLAGESADRQVDLTRALADDLFGREPTESLYRDAVKQAMREVDQAKTGPARERAAKKLEGLLAQPKQKVRDWKRFWLGKKLVVSSGLHVPAEKMRARLERVRKVIQDVLQGTSEIEEAGLDRQIQERLRLESPDIQAAQFQRGAAAATERGGVVVTGELLERVPSRSLTTEQIQHYREEPRALRRAILESIAALEKAGAGGERSDLTSIKASIQGVADPDRVWGDFQSREMLRLVDQSLRELSKHPSQLSSQSTHDANPPTDRDDPNARLWYCYWWADLLKEKTQALPAPASGVGEALQQLEAEGLRERREFAERTHLTQSKALEMRGGKAKPISGEAQRIMQQSRGSYLVEQHRPGQAQADTLVVSHRYDPDRPAEFGTVPSAAGKQAPVLTSARTLYDVQSGQSLTAHGRLNTVDRVLETQVFLLSELFEDPQLCSELGEILRRGIPSDERAQWEVWLRNIRLPTGLEWAEQKNGQLEWVAAGDRWKPKLVIHFLDLNLLTPGLGGPDTGDQPEWAPATALWKRGEKGKAIALVAGRLLGLPYLAEKLMAKFLAEQRWSEQEAASADFLRGQTFELLGIPVELDTLMITRPLNIFAEGEPLHSLPMPHRVKDTAQRLSSPSEQVLRRRLDEKLDQIRRDQRLMDSLMTRPFGEVRREYLDLERKADPATARQREQLREFLHLSTEQLEAQKRTWLQQVARLEGLWRVAFDLETKSTPEARLVALIELTGELNVRIGAHCKSGKDRTGNLVALFGATRQWFRENPDVAFETAEEWVKRLNEIPKDPLFQASFANYDEILSQQQADMMQWDRKLDRSPVAHRLAGTKLGSTARPYSWVEPPPENPASGGGKKQRRKSK